MLLFQTQSYHWEHSISSFDTVHKCTCITKFMATDNSRRRLPDLQTRAFQPWIKHNNNIMTVINLANDEIKAAVVQGVIVNIRTRIWMWVFVLVITEKTGTDNLHHHHTFLLIITVLLVHPSHTVITASKNVNSAFFILITACTKVTLLYF